MKTILFTLVLLLSNNVLARQYIQCGDSHSWDGAVINLDGEHSTLFMTTGVHLPDEDRLDILKELIFLEYTQNHAIFYTDDGQIKDVLKIPLDILGQYSQSFIVIFEHVNLENGYTRSREMYCFSAIY